MVFSLSNIRREDFFFFSIFAIGYSAAFGITNFHQSTFSYIRNIFILLAMLTIFARALNIRTNTVHRRDNVVFLSTYIFLLIYGLIWSSLWGGIEFLYEDQTRIVILALSVLYCFSLFEIIQAVVNDNRRWAAGIPEVSLFVVVSTLVVLATGGLKLSPLMLNFETVEGATAVYSQGFTKICAIAGVYFVVIATNVEKRALPLYALAAMFLILSILGGSRGDILAGFFALAFFLLRRPNALNMTLVIAGALLIFVFIIQSGAAADFAVFNRFLQLSDGNYSMRDLLFGQAVDVIWTSPCSLFGCGFNFFQLFNNYQFGLYPHNVFLESIITFGVFVGGLAVLLSIYGAMVLYIRIGKNPIFYILLVDFFSLQKSSSLIDFTTLPTLLCFAWFGGRALFGGYSRIGAQGANPQAQ